MRTFVRVSCPWLGGHGGSATRRVHERGAPHLPLSEIHSLLYPVVTATSDSDFEVFAAGEAHGKSYIGTSCASGDHPGASVDAPFHSARAESYLGLSGMIC